MRVVLTEASSLTARETLTVLGARGLRPDLLTAPSWPLARFSRLRGRLLRAPAPATDPLGYVTAVAELLRSGRADVVLPTHEQAWLLAAGRHLLPADAALPVADVAAHDQVQGKLTFARLLDTLDVPQPRWWLPGEAATYPYWVKASFGTAGRSVRLVRDDDQLAAAVADLDGGGPLMCQAPAPGRYAQVQAVFAHGRMIGAHTCEQDGVGAGGSAAARRSVDHPRAREAARRVGERLGWHGGLTLDYLHVDGRPQVIECNPRMVEPGNAAAAGVDLPALMITAATGVGVPDEVRVGRPGVRTRSTMALAIGAAERTGRRGAVLRAWADRDGGEVLTPALHDPPSALPLIGVTAALLARPAAAGHLASATVAAYAVPPSAVDVVRRREGSS